MKILKRTKILAAFMALLMTAVIAGCSADSSAVKSNTASGSGSLKVTYIDIGQGDSELIETPDGKTMLIDTGESSESNKLDDALKKHGITKIDVLIGTHPHTDHIGGMRHVVENYSIGKIYMPNASANTKTFEKLLDAIDAANIPAYEAKSGVSLDLGEYVECSFFGPAAKYSDLNDTSAVLMLKYGDTGFLFTGDAEKTAEHDILDEYANELQCDVLKVGHHGSSTSTSEEFLDAANPTYAIISCGKNNDYGHPHAETLSKLSSRNIQVFRTDLSGDITAYSDGKSVSVSADGNEVSSKAKAKSSAKATASSDKMEETVYITKSGKAYHKTESCSGLRSSKSISAVTLEEAISMGRKPCSVCYS